MRRRGQYNTRDLCECNAAFRFAGSVEPSRARSVLEGMTYMDTPASTFNQSTARTRATRLITLACAAFCAVAQAIEPPELQPPEVDTTVEVIAVPVGGRTVVAQIVDRGTMFRTE